MKTQEKNFFFAFGLLQGRSSLFLISSAQPKFLALVFISEGAGQNRINRGIEERGYSVMSKEMGGGRD
jgi:hypothetical protein